jgi:enoyl reductase-like protein
LEDLKESLREKIKDIDAQRAELWQKIEADYNKDAALQAERQTLVEALSAVAPLNDAS